MKTLKMFFSATETRTHLIAGARMFFQGHEHTKKVLFRLLENRWTSTRKQAGRHQITWSLLPPTSKSIMDVHVELRQKEQAVIKIAEEIFR